MQDLEQLAELLVAADPASATDTLLRYVCQRHAAAGGLVIALEGKERIVRAVSSLDLAHVGAVQKLWNSEEDALCSGRRVITGTYAIMPLMNAGELVGALVLDNAKQLEPERLTAFLVALAKAVTAAATPARPRVDHGVLLQRTLDENAWNVARVARTLGVTRRTIYMRMQRFGIPRRRVPKILKHQ
jgi:transcriptional regulator with GAF, ATPase, and Fis domain